MPALLCMLPNFHQYFSWAFHKVLLNSPTALCAADGKAQMTDWPTFELNPTVIQRVASSTSPLAANAATIAVAELTVR